MNIAETIQRSLLGLTLFMGRLVMSLLPSRWSSSSLEGDDENENEDALSPPSQTIMPVMMSNQNRRSNSHSRNSFYPGRRVPSTVFYNVNNFNFSRESFSSNFIFAPLLPVLLGFLQSSGMNPSPFELRPMVFMVSVGCSVAYFFTLPAKFMFPGFASHFGLLASAFGSIAVATLIALILYLPWWSTILILLFMGGVFKLLNKLHTTYANARGRQTRTMQPLLPMYRV